MWHEGGWTGDAAGEAALSRRGFLRAGLMALVPGCVAGCLPTPTAPDPNQPDPWRLTARPHAPSLAAVPGATWLDINTVGRDGILYVPDGYDPTTPAPLLVTLHGRGGGATDWDGFQPACDTRGLVMLAVESRGATWDRVSGYFGPDVLYTDAALAHTFDRCAIDPTRIALVGFSDGASYCLSLGPCNGDLFTHLIAFSPGFTAPRELIGRPKVFMSHGLDDPVLPERNTFDVILPALRDEDYDVTYVQFQGGHEVPADIGGAALDWFLA